MFCEEGHLLNIPLSMELLITIWMVFQYTQSLQKYMLPSNSVAGEEGNHEANGDSYRVGFDRRKLCVDQQHCSYSTVLT